MRDHIRREAALYDTNAASFFVPMSVVAATLAVVVFLSPAGADAPTPPPTAAAVTPAIQPVATESTPEVPHIQAF